MQSVRYSQQCQCKLRRVCWNEFTKEPANCIQKISSDRCRSRLVRMGISKKAVYERHSSVDKANPRAEVRKRILTSSTRSGSRSSCCPNLQFPVSILIVLNPEYVKNRETRDIYGDGDVEPKPEGTQQRDNWPCKMPSQYFLQTKTFTHVGADVIGTLYCCKFSGVQIYANTHRGATLVFHHKCWTFLRNGGAPLILRNMRNMSPHQVK